MLIDQEARIKATNPEDSYIVQAPAGSGKTEILSQRFLRLLGRVEAPEHIVALTFTRKAASEMRERVLAALHKAARGEEPTSPHLAQTLSYARDALARNDALNWQLLNQPSRLRIMTIDSLCHMISQAIPLQEKQIAFAQITDLPESFYLKAAKACFQFACEHTDYQDALKTVLLHLDNRQDKLIDLMKNLLQQRDHWLEPLYLAKNQEKSMYEKAILRIETHALQCFYASIPKELGQRLMTLANTMAVLENDSNSPRYSLRNYFQFETLDKEGLSALSALLLTSQGVLRQGFDHHVGLKRATVDEPDYTQIKKHSKSVLSELTLYPDFLETLLLVRQLPDPHYAKDQWEVLQALFTLLPLLVGHLHVCFSENNALDFATVSQQALFALGESENPTDLALYLDNTIHHLLIDEFQDTSITQFQLITQLVQGWLIGDGKTLFVVGDPMQSIYRFRQAEVGLFLKAQAEGIGPVLLNPLSLQCNFRSQAGIIDWVNQQFKSIFPLKDDIESGAVSFHPSTSVKELLAGDAVSALQLESKMEEAQAIIDIIQQHYDESIAILVRSRSQLTEIIRLLREHHIPYQGVDIDLLSILPHVQNAWSLTKALLMPANRLAWLEVLRSPACGLSLNDLHAIAASNSKQSIYQALSEAHQNEALSEEGRKRCAYVYSILHNALINRAQTSLSEWVSLTQKQLQSHLFLSSSEQEDLEQFWALLDKYEEDGQLPNIDVFKKAIMGLYSQQVTPSNLQIMTIHKSKGLEFDCVILPGLGAASKNREAPLFKWLKLPVREEESMLLISPIKAAHAKNCPLYDYIGLLDEQKNHYEQQRLLYVAVTRAKKRLYLLNNSTRATSKSFMNLLQHQVFTPIKEETSEEKATVLPQFYKLPQELYETPPSFPSFLKNQVNINPSTDYVRLAGIATHQILQWICDNHPTSSEEIPEGFIEQCLNAQPFDNQQKEAITLQIQQQISTLFRSQKGSWIIKKHLHEKNEYALLVNVLGKVVTRIIDRTFIEDGTRWIIDFKTGKMEVSNHAHHQKQVNEYAAYLQSRGSLPIKCAIYYLSEDKFVPWDWLN